MKAKKTPYQKQKLKTWRAFSRYIRIRDCIETTGWPYQGRCFTCGDIHPLPDLHAGHVVGGRRNAQLFDEKGVFAQCARCNLFEGGRPHEARDYVVAKYGEEVFEELRRQRDEHRKYTMKDLRAIEQEFKTRAEQMLEEFQE